MGTIYVKTAKSLPITFTQKEGDKQAATLAVHSAVDANTSKGNIAVGLLQIMGHHWSSLHQVGPINSVPGEERAWNKATGLPLVREMVRVAYGHDLGEIAEGEMAPYFTRLAQGVFYSVSPFAPNEERLLNWGEYVKAVAAKRGKEPSDKAILRGIQTFIRRDKDGNVHIPSRESAISAAAELDKAELRALAMVMSQMIGVTALAEAAKEMEALRQRDVAEAASAIVE